MEDTSEHVQLQLRVGDKIYESVVSSNAVPEILMKGDSSDVARTVSQSNPVSTVMGKYNSNVEVLSVSPIPQAEGNEMQVSKRIVDAMYCCVCITYVSAWLQIIFSQQVAEAVGEGERVLCINVLIVTVTSGLA